MSDERRDTQRLTILGSLYGEVMLYEPMTIKDLGVGGATIETRFPLHVDSLHDLRLVLGDLSVVVKGRVVHAQICDVDQDIVTYRTGIEFVEASERVVNAIGEFLANVQATRRGGVTGP